MQCALGRLVVVGQRTQPRGKVAVRVGHRGVHQARHPSLGGRRDGRLVLRASASDRVGGDQQKDVDVAEGVRQAVGLVEVGEPGRRAGVGERVG